MQFSLVQLIFKTKTKPIQRGLVGSVVEIFCETILFFVSNIEIKLKTIYFQQCFKFDPTLQIHFHPTNVSIKLDMRKKKVKARKGV